MKILKELEGGVLIIQSPHFKDERGGFLKFFNHAPVLNNYSIAQVNFVQNHELGILRGLHFQTGEFAESKFFRVLSGCVNLVYLNIDPKSSLHHLSGSYVLDQPDIGVLIPEGFATGYEVLSPNSDVLYFSNKDYNPQAESGINWLDPLVSMHWKTTDPIVSDKDEKWMI